jgi:hypothetical protein
LSLFPLPYATILMSWWDSILSLNKISVGDWCKWQCTHQASRRPWIQTPVTWANKQRTKSRKKMIFNHSRYECNLSPCPLTLSSHSILLIFLLNNHKHCISTIIVNLSSFVWERSLIKE